MNVNVAPSLAAACFWLLNATNQLLVVLTRSRSRNFYFRHKQINQKRSKSSPDPELTMIQINRQLTLPVFTQPRKHRHLT
jgi:hypothetical protein